MAKRQGRATASGAASKAAQSFGIMLGRVAARVDGWLAQREDIARELNDVITRAQDMMANLGNATGNASQGSSASTRATGAVPAAGGARKAKKRRTMSAEARAKIAAAQRARWAKQKGEAASASPPKVAGKTKKARSA